MKRIAAIDIGTNTALLLVSQLSAHGDIQPLIQKETIVRLGEGVDRSGLLKPEAIKRTLITLNDYIKMAHDLGAKVVLASGTSALRDAKNRENFVAQVKKKLYIDIRVLTGDEEARLTYFGALSNKAYLEGRIFLIDIGGGSTEFITGTRNAIKNALSLDIGSVRLTERFVKHDPITEFEFNKLKQSVNEQLKYCCKNQWDLNSKHFIGVAGTVTTLAAMHMELEPYDSERVDGSILTYEQLTKIINTLKIKSLKERKMLPGLKPERADVILAGAVILLETMRQFNFQKIIVSDRGLRFGMIVHYLQLLRE